MARKRNYHYSDTRSTSTGEMCCAACGKPITEGRYRYFIGGSGCYVNHHESCCSDDPAWAAMDQARYEMDSRYAEFQAACRAFKKQWSEFLEGELDEYIGETP